MASEIKLKLAIEGGQAVGAVLDGVGSSLDNVENKAKGASSGAETLRNTLAAIGTIGTALALIKMADAATSLHTSLRLASNSAAEAGVAYERLFTIAQNARVSFTELGATYGTIARAGNELGVSQDRLLTVTQAIGYAMTIGGGSAQSMNAALVQLGQGLGSGTLRGDELNSILEQTPRLAKALADGIGVSVGQLRSLGEQGKLTAETVISALEKSAPQLAKEMASSTVTVGQAFTMLTNSATKFVGEADSASGASSALAGALQGIAGAVDTVGNAINEHKVAFGAITAGLAGAAAVAGVAALASNIGLVTVAVKALGAVMMANPIILGIAAIVAGGFALNSLADSAAKSEAGMGKALQSLDDRIAFSESRRSKMSTEGVQRLEAMKEERKRIYAEIALMANGQDASSNAKEMKGYQEKIAAEQAAYAGAKPLDEVRKMAKLRNDVVQQGYDEAVELAKGYSKAIASASSPEQVVALEKERSARLIASAQETTAALKSFDDQKAAPAKEAAKQRLDVLIAGYEQDQVAIAAGEQRNLESLSAAHALGLESDRSYIAAKQAIAAQANTEQQGKVQQELDAVKHSGLALKDRQSQEEKYVLELKKLREQAKGIVQKADEEIAAADNKVFRAAMEQNASFIEAQQAKATSLEEQVKAQRIANGEIGLTAVEVNKLRSATMELAAAEKDRLAGNEADPLLAQAYRDQAKAMRELIVVNTDGVQKSAALEGFKSAWASVDQTARGVFTNIFEGGQDAFTKLRDTLKGTLLDLLYQMTVRKWVFEIFANVTGAGSSGMAAGIMGNSGGGLTGLINGASTANSVYANGSSYLSTGYQWLTNSGAYGGMSSGLGSTGLGTAVNGGNTSLAALYSDAGYGGTAASGLASVSGSTGAVAGGVEVGGSTGIGSGTALGASTAAEGTGSIMAAGSMAGPIGLAVAAVIAFLASRDSFRVSSTGDSTSQYDSTGRLINRSNQMFGGDQPVRIVTVANGEAVANPQHPSDFLTNDLALTDGHTQAELDAQYAANNVVGDAHFAAISSAADKYTQGLNAAYLAAAQNLGVGAVSTNFTFGTNDTRSGGGARLGASAGDRQFDSGDISLSQADLTLAANRAILTALEGSDLPRWMQGVFDGVDAATLDQTGIDAAIKSATDLKAAYAVLATIPGVDLTDISFETLNSLKAVAPQLAAVDSAFSLLGYRLMDVSAAGGAAAAGLVAAMGGLQSFQASMSSYYQNYYTQDEQSANRYSSVQANLHAVGIDYTVDQLRSATRGDIRSAVDSAFNNAGTTDAQKAALISAANSLTPLTPALNSVATAAQAATSAVGGGGGGGGGSGADSGLSDWQRATQAIVDTMKDLRNTLIGTGPDSFAKMMAQFTIEKAQAKAGDLAAAQDLPELAKSLVSASKNFYRTSVEQSLFTARIIEQLGDVAGVPSAGALLSVPHFAAGGVHSGGWAMVGEEGPELAYMPSARIYNARDTRSMLSDGSGGGSGETSEVVTVLRYVAAVLEGIATNTGSTASSSSLSASVLVGASKGARPLRTKEVA